MVVKTKMGIKILGNIEKDEPQFIADDYKGPTMTKLDQMKPAVLGHGCC